MKNRMVVSVAFCMVFAVSGGTLSTGVEIPPDGAPVNNGGHQFTTRTEKRPAAITNEAQYLKWKWRTNLANPKTGVDNATLRAGVTKIWKECGWKAGKEDWYDVAARCFDYLVDNVAIGFSEYDYFPSVSAWDRHLRPMNAVLWQHAAEVDDKYDPGLRAAVAQIAREQRATVGKDFDHSAPDWEDMLKIGFPGMKARVDAYPDSTPFYRAEKRAAAAMMRFLDRLIAEAVAERARQRARCPLSQCGHPDTGTTGVSPVEVTSRLDQAIDSLRRLRVGPPQSVFDVMEFTMVYFILSEPLNYFQVRTFDNIDARWWPIYQRDLAAGRTTEAKFREEFRHFLWQFGSIDNYWGHPIYLGGTKKNGTTEYNPLSLIILDVVEKTALPTPKFQLKYAANTPDEIWWKSLGMLRRHAPLVLMGEEGMARSMRPVGLTDEECRDLLIWGCFEYLPRGKGNCTSSTRIVLPQPVVELMAKAAKGEFTAATFDDFKKAYFEILHANTDRAIDLLTRSESHLAEINPALVLSLAVPSALEKGVDAFSLGYKYNFTAVAECGFATTVDSLLGIKEFVYDRKALTLAEFGRILAADWKDHEDLRLRVKRSKLKWGCGNPEADALAKEVIEGFTGHFVGRPNARGGKYVCYGLQSRAHYQLGPAMSATPDGRKKGDYFSKNMAPNVGAETEGITGSLKSNSVIAPENFPCGSIYDVMIHPLTVGGENAPWTGGEPDKGLRVFRTLVEQFFANGGVALNVNIVSPETLRDAQAHPEKYENLQVRVAGWNVRWNDIPRREQNEFIARIECVGF